ncbi:974_t:CDS:2, partial [Dentiscutata erythropus]
MEEATLAHRITNRNLEMAYKCFNAYAQMAKFFLDYYLYKKLINTPYSDKEREKHAAQLFKEATNSGNEVPNIQLKYGLCLFQGIGVERNFLEAAKYFQKATDNGLVVGMYNAGNLFYSGLTGVKDEELGIKYIREAAQYNHSDAIEFYVENIVNDTTIDNDKISKLCEISEKYDHFYANHLILGGAIIRNEEFENSKVKTTNAQVRVGITKIIIKHENNATYSKKVMNNNTNHIKTIIGGTDYSQNDTNPWRESLNDKSKWKIIGYEEVYPLFELLDNELKKKVLSAMGHQILE